MTRVAATNCHRLRVAEVVAETADAASLVFELSDEQRPYFTYRPGQFLTVRVPSDQTPAARCYSLSSSPHTDEQLKVTVKRTSGGYGSNWLCDNASPGSELDVLEPAGVFTPANLNGQFALVAGGSGITPMMSIIKSVLHAGTGSTSLIYANRDEKSVIFGTELTELVDRFPDRLRVIHWLETVQGLPCRAALTPLLRLIDVDAAFLCGPAPFMDAAKGALQEVGLPKRDIHIEKFASLSGDPFFQPATESPTPVATEVAVTQLEVTIDGETRDLPWHHDRLLLDVLLEAGLDAPSSCREGLCAACECRLLEGRVRMRHNEVLDDEDIAGGAILGCQAVPDSDVVRVSYDD